MRGDKVSPSKKPAIRIMLNPSVQYGNIVRENGEIVYNEGENMFDIAEQTKALLDGVEGLEVFLSRAHRRAESSLDAEIHLTNLLRCDLLVSFHSDAAPGKPWVGGTWTFAKEEDFELARCVQNAVLEAIRISYPQVRDRGVREHWNRLRVLWETDCPACLTEVLFHTNPTEREILKKEEFHRQVAEGFARGIVEYLRKVRGFEGGVS